MLNLFVLSNALNLIGVALLLWLGFYNLTRSPQRILARATALTLWAGAAFCLSNLMYYNRLPELDNRYWLGLFRWSTQFLPALWLHLTGALLPAAGYQRQRLVRLGAYVVAAALTALDSLRSSLLLPENLEAARIEAFSKVPAALFPIFILYLGVCTGLAARNLWIARREAQHAPPMRNFLDSAIRGTLLAGLGGFYLTAGIQLGWNAPNLPGDFALIAGAGLMGYATARVAALLDGRSAQRDFLYTFLAIALVCGAYLLATLISYIIYGIPFVTFIFVLMLAVISHSAYDWARSSLDRFFFRTPTRELRANLRALAHEAGGDQNLRETLRALLPALCRSIGASRALLLLRDGEQYVADAAYHMNAPEPLAESLVRATDLTPFDGLPGLGSPALLIPLHLVAKQEGGLLLGPKLHGGAYSDEDEDLIFDVAGRMELLLVQIQLRDERTRQLNVELARFRETEREAHAQSAQPLLSADNLPAVMPGYDEKQFTGAVEDALRHLNDITYLGEHALTKLSVIARRLSTGATTNLDRGRALKEVLIEALDKLRPAAAEPRQPGSEWYPFLVLRDAYVIGVPNREIMARYYISEGTFNRTRRRAIRSMARALAETAASDQEAALRQSQIERSQSLGIT